MKYVPPLGESDGPYVNRSLPLVRGSKLDAKAIDMLLSELEHVVVYAGLTPSDSIWTQVREAVELIASGAAAGIQTLTYGATIPWVVTAGRVAKVVLAGNGQLLNPTGLQVGETYLLHVLQDATGGRALTYDTAFVWPDDAPPPLSMDPGARTVHTFACDEVGGTKYLIGVSTQGYSL